jgi:hypothetical protein
MVNQGSTHKDRIVNTNQVHFSVIIIHVIFQGVAEYVNFMF